MGYQTDFVGMMLIIGHISKRYMIQKKYMGIDKDPHGAMNPTGNIIRDAWVFGLIPESETCEGWTGQGVDALYDRSPGSGEIWLPGIQSATRTGAKTSRDIRCRGGASARAGMGSRAG
jgi:hypothetical protein